MSCREAKENEPVPPPVGCFLYAASVDSWLLEDREP